MSPMGAGGVVVTSATLHSAIVAEMLCLCYHDLYLTPCAPSAMFTVPSSV